MSVLLFVVSPSSRSSSCSCSSSEPDWIALVPISGQYALLNRALRGEGVPMQELALSWIVPVALIGLALYAVARLWSRESILAGK